jgi:hypothetical protein
MIGLPMAYHALGRKADSDAALAAAIAKYEKQAAYNIAYVYAYHGEADNAPSRGSTRRSSTVTRAWARLGGRACSATSTKTRAGCRSCANVARRRSNWPRSESKVPLPQ